MKKYLFLFNLLLLFFSISYCQNDIRLDTPEADFIRNIMPSDSSDYIANVDIKNLVTGEFDSTIVMKIGKDGVLMNTLNVSSHFPNAKANISGKSLKLPNSEYIALCNIYYGQDSIYRTGLLYFNDDLEVTSIKMMGDSLCYQKSGAMMINSKNQLIVCGSFRCGSDTNYIDSIFIREYTLQGDIIKEGRFFNLFANAIQNVIELPYYGKYVLHYGSNMENSYVDTNLMTFRTIFNGCSGCYQSTPWTYQISDRKFIKALWIFWCNPNTGEDYPNDVGFMVKDTTPSMPLFDTITTIYKFGEMDHYDFICGLDFVAPDTVYLLYKFVDTTISNRDVYTLQKSTTTGTVIWSKNYTCDVNRWLAVEATDTEILMYGRFWNGDDHMDDENSWNPMIVRLNKDGVVQSTTDANFRHAEVLLYPNPANSMLNIRIENGERKIECLKISNMMGQCMYKSDESQSKQGLNLKIDVSGFAKGAYFLQLIGNNYHVTKKFIVN